MRFYKYTPAEISNTYLDDVDYNGLLYIYNDLVDYDKEINKKSSK